MKSVFISVFIFITCEASAQTLCLGANCDLEQPGVTNPGAPAIVAPPSAFDQWLSDYFQNGGLDPDREDCIRQCDQEFTDRVLDCLAVHNSTTDPLRGDNLDACLEWARHRRWECYGPSGLMQCG